MAVYTYNWTGTANADNRVIYQPNTRDQWDYTFDGLGGTDALSFERLPQSEFTIYRDAEGVHVDSVASASHNIYVTLRNVETLRFGDGYSSNRTAVNLLTYFGDTTAPSVVSFNPADGSTGIPVGADIVIAFSEAVSRGTGLFTLRTARGTVETFDAATSTRVTGWGGTTLTINPTSDLGGDTVHSLDIAATAVRDASNNPYAGTTTYDFRTFDTPPSVSTPIADQHAAENVAFSFQFASNTFTDPDAGDTLAYAATRLDGTALPAWIAFDPASRTFSGTPASADVGAFDVKVTATDSGGASASDTFALDVASIGVHGRAIQGSAAADTLPGGAGDDTIVGLGGNDRLEGLGGGDRLDGGDGVDTALFRGSILEYAISRTGQTIRVEDKVADRDGVDTGTAIERLQFSDMSVNLTVQSAAASIAPADLDRIAELYVGFFGRVPAADGLENWVNQFKGGKTMFQIADDFYGIGSGPSLRSYTGYWDTANDRALSSEDYVRIVYRNVLGREGKAGGIAYWTGQLDRGDESRGSLVCKMLDSAHTYKDNADWGWVANLLDDEILMSKMVSIDWGLNYAATAQAAIEKGIAIASACDLSANPNPALADTPVKTFDFHDAIALVGVDPTMIDLVP